MQTDTPTFDDRLVGIARAMTADLTAWPMSMGDPVEVVMLPMRAVAEIGRQEGHAPDVILADCTVVARIRADQLRKLYNVGRLH